jgi:hypothetical protein
MRKTGLLVAASLSGLVILFAALPARTERNQGPASRTKAYSVDGRKFIPNPSAGDDLDPLRREFEKLGFGESFPGLSSPQSLVFRPPLVEDAAGGAIPPPPLPQGFRLERIIRMDSDIGSVDLGYGSTEHRGVSLLDRMRAARWECLPAGGGGISAATIRKEKESSLVFLEEKEGKFLIIRRLEK